MQIKETEIEPYFKEINVDANNNEKKSNKKSKYEYKVKKNKDGTYKEIPTSKGIKKVKIIEKPKERYKQEMFKDIEKFDKEVWTQGEGLKTGIKSIDKILLGIQPGFHMIAGDSNLGKSAFITQLEHGLITNNENIYLMSFSLDDPKKDKIARAIATANKIPINIIKNPKNFKDDPNFQAMMYRREKGLNDLKLKVDKYKITDLTETTDITKIHKKVREQKAYFESHGINKKIVVTIDSFHDLSTKESFYSDNALVEYMASYISDMAINENIAIIVTGELKKVYNYRRPMIDDIKGGGKIKYEAKSIILVHNEVHYKGENASIYYIRKSKKGKQPVFEANIAKNKFNDTKGTVFFEFFPDLSYMKESDDTATKQYTDLLYSGN
jgi:replicative DNA helicase